MNANSKKIYDISVVNAPSEYANSLLNGETVVELSRNSECVLCIIVTGKDAGREWLFMPGHLKPKSRRNGAGRKRQISDFEQRQASHQEYAKRQISDFEQRQASHQEYAKSFLNSTSPVAPK